MAALSAAAVVAASAAVMAVPTSAAADITLGISSKEVTLDELAASGNKVTLDITSSAEFNSCGVGVTLNDGLEYDEEEGMYPTVKKGQGSAVSNGNFVFMPFAYAPVPLKTLELASSLKSLLRFRPLLRLVTSSPYLFLVRILMARICRLRMV